MKKRIIFGIRQCLKMFLQHVVFPGMYWLGCCIHKVDPELVAFADAHHTELPFSMQCMYQEVSKRSYRVQLHLYDYSNEGEWRSLLHSISFMLLYSQAKYVFICDNFLPVSSCRKRKETQVIQLWHSCGLMKKMGYDTTGDIPAYYQGNVYRNYDLVTVSAPCCVPVLTSAMRQEDGIVQALGVSRTDVWFSEEWMSACREEFFACHPYAKGKKIIVWAPTFRGSASSPEVVEEDAINRLEEVLGSEWILIRKLHPHIEVQKKDELSKKKMLFDWPTERYLPVADLLITDYSSILFDYILLQKPFVLFAPDCEEYEKERGLYVEYDSLTTHIAKNAEQLIEMVPYVWAHRNQEKEKEMLRQCQQYHTSACDGHATQRILSELERRNK